MTKDERLYLEACERTIEAQAEFIEKQAKSIEKLFSIANTTLADLERAAVDHIVEKFVEKLAASQTDNKYRQLLN